MPSDRETIEKVKTAVRMSDKGKTLEQIADWLDLSPARIREFLERNSHSLECPTCRGFGVNIDRRTGERAPICDR